MGNGDLASYQESGDIASYRWDDALRSAPLRALVRLSVYVWLPPSPPLHLSTSAARQARGLKACVVCANFPLQIRRKVCVRVQKLPRAFFRLVLSQGAGRVMLGGYCCRVTRLRNLYPSALVFPSRIPQKHMHTTETSSQRSTAGSIEALVAVKNDSDAVSL